MSEYWIRKGTNDFCYEFFIEDGVTGRTLSMGDQYYDAVVLEPIEGGIHVIEYIKYKELEEKLKLAKEVLEFYATNKTTVIEVKKSVVAESKIGEQSLGWEGAAVTILKTIDSGEKAQEALVKIRG